jgi:hypothetical protein
MSSSGIPASQTLLSVDSKESMPAGGRKPSFVWHLIRLLGSLKLALLLLATIAVACAVATFMESRFDATVAKAWIYKSPWFVAWLGVLCINLFAATLTRWPWRKRHAGFIMTHYGIILLLAGAVTGSKLGFEGNVTLRTDGGPQRRVVTDRSTLQVESPADGSLYLLPFDARLVRPTPSHPRILGIPGTPLEMVIDDSSDQLGRKPVLRFAEGPAAGNGAIIRMFSKALEQSLKIALGSGEGAPANQDFFGLARISFADSLPPQGKNRQGESRPWIELAPGKNDGLLYQSGRSSNIVSSGHLGPGESLPLGWADWTLTLEETGKRCVPGSVWQPSEEEGAKGIPGFHAYLRSSDQIHGGGNRGPALWIPSGEIASLMLGNEVVRVGYGLELRTLPFSVALADFQVPRDEGTENPSDFRAFVLFRDPGTERERRSEIRMNHPASWPGGVIAAVTGFNYKFSQAEWNPRDLGETTLQVLYDPGWLPKWVGSLAICLGIATMFYLRPRS